MTEDFLSRWARLKRESAAESPQRSEAQTPDSAPSAPDPAAAQEFDVSSVPAIESISAQSSVAAFLRAGVPEDLTRAALRNAWVSDPAIRDFVGIAENQWDFNGEGTIAGFGPLSAEEYARYVATRTLRADSALAAPGVENADKRESSGAMGAHESTDGPPAPSASASPSQSHPIDQPSVGQSQAMPATSARVFESSSASQTKRTHGSALPNMSLVGKFEQ